MNVMGNANGREEGGAGAGAGGVGGAGAGANDEIQINGGDHSMSNISPPATPHRSRSPLLFAPQVRIRVGFCCKLCLKNLLILFSLECFNRRETYLHRKI